ncbi:hypothetical protein [Streptomyces sp. NPDC002644]
MNSTSASASAVSVTFTHRDGAMDTGTEAGLPALLAELDGPRDDEHPDVSVTDDDSGWTVAAFQGGTLVLENLEHPDPRPRHLPGITRAEALRTLTLLVRGDLPALHRLDWRPGYG